MIEKEERYSENRSGRFSFIPPTGGEPVRQRGEEKKKEEDTVKIDLVCLTSFPEVFRMDTVRPICLNFRVRGRCKKQFSHN